LLDLLLDGLHEELGYLRRAELIPRERCFAFLDDEQTDAVLEVVDGDSVCGNCVNN